MIENITRKKTKKKNFLPSKRRQEIKIPSSAFLELVIIVTYKIIVEISMVIIFFIRLLFVFKTRKYEKGQDIASQSPA